MSRQARGAYLYLRRAHGTRKAVWIIRDGDHRESTSCGPGESDEAQRRLAAYITVKYQVPRIKDRDPDAIPVAEVIKIYADEVARDNSRPKELGARLKRVEAFFGELMLSDVTKTTCKAYAEHRGKPSAARRELEDLRAAIGYYWRQGLCASPIPVWLPPRGVSRQRWLTRSEAARLLWGAYRHREEQLGNITARHTLQHVARFILVGLYTGTRAGAICNAAFTEAIGRGWIDLESGSFHRQAVGAAQTKKRAPTIRIPPRLLAHIRRWHRLGIAKQAVVEWNGARVKKINKGFRRARSIAGLGPDVVPHVLRHTCATWLAQRRTPISEICGFLGMTEEMFERVYGHHHPDYQATAVNALTSSGGQSVGGLTATKRELGARNVLNLLGKRV